MGRHREEFQKNQPPTSRKSTVGHPGPRPSRDQSQGMAGLQATAGNGAVVQMLRQAGHRQGTETGGGDHHSRVGRPGGHGDVSVQRLSDSEPQSPDVDAPTSNPFDVADFGTALEMSMAQAYLRQNVPELENWANDPEQSDAYHFMTGTGEKWQQYMTSGGPEGHALIASMSDTNMKSMRQELEPDAGWEDTVRRRLEAALAERELHHYTTRNRAELALNRTDHGTLSSRRKQWDESPDISSVHDNTEPYDEEQLANDAFVFFFIAKKDAPFRRTRFSEGDASGPARIALPLGRVSQSGWIMINDFYDMEYPTLRSSPEGELLSYRRDDTDMQQYKSPEAKLQKARIDIGRIWEEFPQLNALVQQLAHSLHASFRSDPDSLSPTDIRQIVNLTRLRKRVQESFTGAGLADRYKELTDEVVTQFEKSIKFSNQVRRFDAYEGATGYTEGGELRYMKGGAGHVEYADAAAANELKRYSEHVSGNILAGPHIIPGLALRGVLEISRIERHGGNEALVRRLKNMSGDELTDVLLKDFVRPQAMMPWSVAITRGDVQYPTH